MAKVKKLLTLEQLVDACKKNKIKSFDAKDTGYTLSVQVPGMIEFAEKQSNTLLYTKVRVCHTNLNRNGSFISEENMVKAIPTLKNQPLLGAFIENENGELDFNGHDMEIVEDENGEEKVVYIERQIGSFDSTFEPYLEYDEEQDKTYVIAMAAIPREYTEAASIIERKNGTKVSCELLINAMQYNSKEKYLELTDFEFSGVCCLGEHVGEGMLGSRLDIADFSTENNSIHFEENKELIEVIRELKNSLDNYTKAFSADEDSKEGGDEMSKFEELLEKYGKTVEDITFDYEGLSDEELEAAFEEAFAEGESEGESNDEPEGVPADEGENEGKAEGTEDEPVVTVTEEVKPQKYSIEMSDGSVKSFELSLNDVQFALYNIVNATYSEQDNCWYDVTVYESHVIMQDWWTGKAYKQSYSREEDSFLLTGDRVEVYATWCTAEEQKELETMRSNYSSLVEYKETKEFEIAHADRISVLADYSSIEKTEEYKTLVENIDLYSKEEIVEKADAIVGKYARQGMQFSASTESKPETARKIKFAINDTKKPKASYSSLFN